MKNHQRKHGNLLFHASLKELTERLSTVWKMSTNFCGDLDEKMSKKLLFFKHVGKKQTRQLMATKELFFCIIYFCTLDKQQYTTQRISQDLCVSDK